MPNSIIVIENPREFLETLRALLNDVEKLMRYVDNEMSTGTISSIDNAKGVIPLKK